MAEPWLRPSDIIEEVERWTGVSRENLLASGGRSKRTIRAKVLLARALSIGLDCSKWDVSKAMGYCRSNSRVIDHLFKKDFDPSEVTAVIGFAKDRRAS